jgi:excisionase family DNA binding protein
LTPAQAAERLGLTKRFIYRLTKQNRIRFVRVGKFLRIRESDLEAFIAAGVVEPVRHGPPSAGNGRRRRSGRTDSEREWKLPRDNDDAA